MLFDLRGRGRRRVVKVIYLGLALLLGGGLVLFGIGGDVQGGLFDAFHENSGSASEQIEKTRQGAPSAPQAQPQQPGAVRELAEREFQLAGQSEGYNPNAQTAEQQFTGESRRHLEAAKRAWERHLRLAGDEAATRTSRRPCASAVVAGLTMRSAVRAQEIVIDATAEPGLRRLRPARGARLRGRPDPQGRPGVRQGARRSRRRTSARRSRRSSTHGQGPGRRAPAGRRRHRQRRRRRGRAARRRPRDRRCLRHALVAQLAEQRTLNPKVEGSIPSGGTVRRPGTLLPGLSFGRGRLGRRRGCPLARQKDCGAPRERAPIHAVLPPAW